MLKSLRVVVMSIAGLTLLVTSATAAFAASWSVNYGPSPAGGYGATSGTLTWKSARSFDYVIDISDVCPNDNHGVGAYWFILEPNNGSGISAVKAYDTNQCGNGYAEWPGTQTWPRNIKKAQSVSCFLETGSNSQCWIVPTNGRSDTFFNPYA